MISYTTLNIWPKWSSDLLHINFYLIQAEVPNTLPGIWLLSLSMSQYTAAKTLKKKKKSNMQIMKLMFVCMYV
jgi:fructose-bisphosphate aldolase class 1